MVLSCYFLLFLSCCNRILAQYLFSLYLCFIVFVAGYPLKLYAMIMLAGVAGLVGLIATAPYRLKRIEAFLDPWADPLVSGFQAVQSLMAIGPAGILGMALDKADKSFCIYQSLKMILFTPLF